MGLTRQILLALFPMALGLAFRLVGLFGDEEGVVLRKFVVRFTMPLLIFFSLYEATAESRASIVPLAGAFVLLTVLLFGVGWLAASLFRRPEHRTAVHACIMLGNYGYMGLGVIGALLGGDGRQMVVYFILLWWPLFFGLGLPIGFVHTRGREGRVPLKRALKVAAPALAAMVLGLGANLAGFVLPEFLTQVLFPFADMTPWLILLSVGLLLDLWKIGTMVKPALLVSAVTLVVAPLVAMLVATALTDDALAWRTIVLEGAMPVATLIPLFEEFYPMDKDVVSTCVVLSTAASLASIPLWALLILQ